MYSSRQKDGPSSSREYSSTSPSPGSYFYEAFGGQQVAFHSQPGVGLEEEGSVVDHLRETEEGGDDRGEEGKKKKGVSSQGDCSEEEPNGVSERRSTTTTRHSEVAVSGDAATNGALS